jgi:hypothetical protein
MRSIKIALGFGFIVALMMSMSVSSASATWDLCVNVGAKKGSFKDPGCQEAQKEGEWEWQTVTGKDKIKIKNTTGGKLALEDMAEKVKIECTGSGEGTVGPSNEDLISKITATACNFSEKKHGSCEEAEKVTANSVNTPWKTELKLISGRSGTWDLITSDGKGEPGWDVECTVGKIFKVSDTCIGEAQTKMKNNAGVVEGKFEGEASGKANCENSIGGKNKEAGLVEGGTIIEAEGGHGLQFLEP